MYMANPSLMLIVTATVDYLRVVKTFVENAILGLGYDNTAAKPLTLAAEEVFCLLAAHLDGDREVKIAAFSGRYYARIDFIFRASELSLEALNLTTSISLEEDIIGHRMGLYLAARMVDRFDLDLESNNEMHLRLTKERSYKERGIIDYTAAGPLECYDIRHMEPEEVEVLAGLASVENAGQVPTFFRFAGKTADMVRAGELEALGVHGPTGAPGGGLAWLWLGPRAVEIFGPYLFNQPDDSEAGKALVEACLSKLARTNCVSVIVRMVSKYLPIGHFQKLGELEDQTGEKGKNIPTYFRLMGEDLGATVWTHPELAGWLTKEYDRLILPRELQPVADTPTERNSVLAARLDKFKAEAQFRPILAGRDIAANLAAHLALFKKEKITAVYFFIDLGQAWQAQFVPALLEQGFVPRLILPYAGRSDLVQFQHRTHPE